MFRLFTDAENVRELLVHRCRSQHFEPRKRRVYEVLFAELLKLGAPSTSETDSDEILTQERQRAGWAPKGSWFVNPAGTLWTSASRSRMPFRGGSGKLQE